MALLFADHLSSSALMAGRVLAVLLPLVIAGCVALAAEAVLTNSHSIAGRRRRMLVAMAAAAGGVVGATVMPGHEALANWIG